MEEHNHEVNDDEMIKYVHFTSLYPLVNKTQYYPLNHPVIITEQFKELEHYFGLMKCDVVPPRGLFHPVLPYRSNGKLVFSLCRTCVETMQQQRCEHSIEERKLRGAWVTEELKKAVELGYEIVKVHEVWHFPERSNELFRVDCFLKLKQEASGFPEWIQTEDDAWRYIAEYARHEGIDLTYEKIVKNPGLRSLAKLVLNR